MQLRTLSFVFLLAICLETFVVEGMEAVAVAAPAAGAGAGKKPKPAKRKPVKDDDDEDDGKEAPPKKGGVDPSATKKQKKVGADGSTGYVYMNVLGPYTTPGLAVVKIGKASVTTLGSRMQTELTAAQRLHVRGQWPAGTGVDAEAACNNRWRESFHPATAQNAIPYVKTFTNLDNAETAVRNAWAHTDHAVPLAAAASLAWFMSLSRVHDIEPLRGSITDFGATRELVAVRWSAIAHVVAAGKNAGEAGWSLDACLAAIAGYAAAVGHPEATPVEWVLNADDQARERALDAIFRFEQFLRANVVNVNAGNFAAFQARIDAVRAYAQQQFQPPPAQPVVAAQQGGPPPVLPPNADDGGAGQ